MEILNNGASAAISSSILVISILVTASASTILLDSSESLGVNQEEISTYVNETIAQITIQFRVRDKIGFVQYVDGEAVVKRIAILLNSYISTPISLSSLLIHLENSDSSWFLLLQDYQSYNSSFSLFKQPLWNKINNDNFSVVILRDNDKSIEKTSMINSVTDLFYIVFELSDNESLDINEKISLTLMPAYGIEKKIDLKVPHPFQKIVHL